MCRCYPVLQGCLHSSLQLPILQGYRVIVQVVIKLTQRTIHIYIYMYKYIYIYTHREREREKERDRETERFVNRVELCFAVLQEARCWAS